MADEMETIEDISPPPSPGGIGPRSQSSAWDLFLSFLQNALKDPKYRNSTDPNRPDFSQPSATERLFYFLENKLGTDVQFLIGGHVPPATVHAHKLILASSSPVFFSMFFGGLGKDEGVIEIPDCEPDSFRLAIEYIYRGALPALPLDKASDLIYVARKYFLQALEDECTNQLKAAIEPDTVIDILRTAHVYDLTSLSSECWEYISHNPGAVLEVSGSSIDLDLLTSILSLSELNITELNLFLGVKGWARNVCAQTPSCSITTGQDIRRTLGDALKLIRFETMQPKEIAQEVAPTEILTLSEIGSIFISMNTTSSSFRPLFSNVPRSRPPGAIIPKNENGGILPDDETGTEYSEFPNIRAARRSRRRTATAASRRNQNLG